MGFRYQKKVCVCLHVYMHIIKMHIHICDMPETDSLP